MKKALVASIAFSFISVAFVPCLATDTIVLNPTAIAAAVDEGPQDGVFDTFVPWQTANNNGWGNYRTIAEFNLAGIPIGSTINSASLSVLFGWVDGIRYIRVDAFAGTGVITLPEFSISNAVGSATLTPSSGVWKQFDVTPFVLGILNGNMPWAGFNIGEYPANTPNFLMLYIDRVTLIVDYTPATVLPPEVSTAEVSDITMTSARGGGNVTSDGGAPILARGVCTSTSPKPTLADSCTKDGTGKGSFGSILTGLTPATTYHARAYATNKDYTAYGGDVQFATLALPPEVSTAEVSDITMTSAKGGGNVTSDGGAPILARGVCISHSPNPALAENCTNDGTGVGSFVSILTGLTPATTYHARAYATNKDHTAYGGDVQFATLALPPEVSTAAISDITMTSAKGGGNVTSDGGAPILARGVCTSPSPNPTLADKCTNDGTGTGSFVSSLTGLMPGTTYHARAYATNRDHTAFGSDLQFATYPGPPGFTISAGVLSATLARGGGWNVALKITAFNGLAGTVSLSDSGVPSGRSSFSPADVTLAANGSASSWYTVEPDNAATPGEHSIKISGRIGAICAELILTLTVRGDVTMILPLPSIGSPLLAQGSVEAAIGSPDSRFSSIISLVNLDRSPTDLSFTVFDAGGSKLAAPGVTNPAKVTLAPGCQYAATLNELFGAGFTDVSNPGWVKVDSTTTEMRGLFLAFDSGLNVLDGAEVTPALLTSLIIPMIESVGHTALFVANPNGETAIVRYELTRSDGTVRDIALRGVYGGQAQSEHLDSLFHGTAPDPADYVRVTSTAGISALILSGIEGIHLEALNALDADAGARILYAPQYVEQNPQLKSTLSVVNLDEVADTVTFQLVDDSGAVIGVSKMLPIAPRGKLLIADQAFFLPSGERPAQGYVRITSSTVRLAGSVVFGDRLGGRFSTALPLVSIPQRSILFGQVASTPAWFTGIAIVNPYGFPANAGVQVFNAEGLLLASRTVSIPAGGRISQLLTELFPDLAGWEIKSGFIKVVADAKIAGFVLLGANDLSVVAALPAQPLH